MLRKEQAAEAAVSGSSARKAPRGSHEVADNFCLIVRKHDEARGSLDVRQNFNLTSIGSQKLATFPKGESKKLHQRQKLKIETIRYNPL